MSTDWLPFDDPLRPPKLAPDQDITLSRHRGADTSIEAFQRLDKTKGQRMVLDALRTLRTATVKEIAAKINRPVNAISGRLTELSVLKEICDTGERRSGCRVYKIRG